MAERRSPKSKAAGSIPSSPAILADLRNVKGYGDIPDEYIKANFDLSQERKKTKKVVEAIPLIRAFIDHIINLHGINTNEEALREGVEITPELLADAIHAIFPPKAVLSMYKKALLYRYEEMFSIPNGKNQPYIDGLEIVLCKEETEYEKTEKLMTRLKGLVFIQLQTARVNDALAKKKKKKTRLK